MGKSNFVIFAGLGVVGAGAAWWYANRQKGAYGGTTAESPTSSPNLGNVGTSTTPTTAPALPSTGTSTTSTTAPSAQPSIPLPIPAVEVPTPTVPTPGVITDPKTGKSYQADPVPPVGVTVDPKTKKQIRVRIPPKSQQVETKRDEQGRVIHQPGVAVDPNTGKSYAPPVPPEKRGPTPKDAPVLKVTAPDPKKVQPETANRLAEGVSKEIRARGVNYNRSIVKLFQRAAGIKEDGEYGGRTRGALVFYGQKDAPPTLYRPHETVPYALI